MKTILGIDLGTNSIGWALIQQNFQNKTGKILGMGSRILPMPQDVLGKFDNGVSVSQTAERTGLRGVRRLRERHLLRRERLHRVLNILGFLPTHYAEQISFTERQGQFKLETEPKLAYEPIWNEAKGKKDYDFIFKDSFNEMLVDFRIHQPQLLKNENGEEKRVPYDWTLYFLRKKALSQKISKEELAWILLNFNQKRGYYQLRGEEQDELVNKSITFHSLKVVDVVDSGDRKGKDEVWYNIHLENGWIYRRTSKVPLDWTGKTKEFIVTTDLNEDGSVKTDKEGKEKRSFRAPAEDDWTLIKKKTENDIEQSHKTVGEYIYDTLLEKPNQKIKGKLVRTVERKFYKEELKQLLTTQQLYHSELQNKELYQACLDELYPYNEPHKTSISNRDFAHLFIEDIIFYQRPLKSKKSLISDCKFERRFFKDKEGQLQSEPIKGIAKSHPLYQEFRLWQFIQNLKIFQRASPNDIDVTKEFLSDDESWTNLFDWLNERKDIDQSTLLKKYLKIKNADQYRWNYVEEKPYPCNETRALIKKQLGNLSSDFLTPEVEESLWHILYSVDDNIEIVKALGTFAQKHGLGNDFVQQFKKTPQLPKEYGAYSAKAIKKLLPLMRKGKYWKQEDVINQISHYRTNINILLGKLAAKDESIKESERKKGKKINLSLQEKLQEFEHGDVEAFRGLEHFMASYLVYGKHSEDSEIKQWKKPEDIDSYLKDFRQHSLRNPIVEQVILETLRVVRDIWSNFGNGKEDFFTEIHLELGREMKNPAELRKKMTAQINENENTNLRIKALLAELMSDKEVENVRPNSPMQQEILKIYEEGILSSNDGDIPDEILKISKQAVPDSTDLKRYKLWLEQGYYSPYTGKIIPLSKLFTRAYDIEHIIPQSRYFDNSLSNKVICESEINSDKGNQTALSYISAKGGSIIPLSMGKSTPLLSLSQYQEHVQKYFAKSRSKMKKLLMEEPPEGFIERQLNDSRYISKVVKSLLSNILREENEQEAISKRLIPVTGAITSQMKHDWGLEHIWNELITPRFERLNALTNSKSFGDINPNTNKFLPQIPLEFQKGASKKRIDHRHHALDALVIASVTREHVNYLNSINSERNNHSLVSLLREKEEVTVNGHTRSVGKAYHKPWPTFTQDSKANLDQIIVSFKQNKRVINKTVNRYQKWQLDEAGKPVKKVVVQTKGDNRAIRKSLHKDTVSGLVELQFKKTVNLSAALDTWERIVDKEVRSKVKELIASNYDKKKVINFFKERNYLWADKSVAKLDVFYYSKDNVASRVKIDDTFNSKKIESITDSGIRKILLNHLSNYNEEKNGKVMEHPELAFSPDGIDRMNENIQQLNNGRAHQPIYKVRTYEPKGSKFQIGASGNKKDKYAEAAKGTNLFFAVYRDDSANRKYETIPFNVVVERQKQGLSSVPEINEEGNGLLFFLTPNDLVYVPFEQETSLENHKNMAAIQPQRVYKMVSSSGPQCFFVRQDVASTIVNKFEFSPLNKTERSIEGIMIKDVCVKLEVNRLGNVKPATSKFYADTSKHQTQNALNEPIIEYIKPPIKIFTSFKEAEDNQIDNVLQQSPEERIHETVELILRTYNTTRDELKKRDRSKTLKIISAS